MASRSARSHAKLRAKHRKQRLVKAKRLLKRRSGGRLTKVKRRT